MDPSAPLVRDGGKGLPHDGVVSVVLCAKGRHAPREDARADLDGKSVDGNSIILATEQS